MAGKIPKKISKSYLENAALYYLQRYATSVENLRRVLERKIDRSCRHHGTDPQDFAPVVEDMITRYAACGLLNDAAYARAQTQSLRRAGKSARAIAARLSAKGLAPDDIQNALSTVDESADAELESALRLARKKKLGRDPERRQKDLAALGRAGFSFDVAKKALAGAKET